MPRFRNTTAIPLDGFADGRQVYPVGTVDGEENRLDEIDLSDEDQALPWVSTHLQQGSLVPVTMATESARRSAPTRAGDQEV